MHPKIMRAQNKVAAAKAQLQDVVAKVQAKCPHKSVIETPWKDLEYFAPLHALRICESCRLEEEGSYWSGERIWSRVDFDGEPLLGNKPGRTVRVIRDRDEFYKLRVR